MRILITGGAGFVGACLARQFKRADSRCEVVAFDNLRRRGSEVNLAGFKAENIGFVHGDIRCAGDLEALPGRFDLVIDACAEPSVHAGMNDAGGPGYVLETNLIGTLNCLEWARRRAGGLVFLSSSRVYSLAALRAIPLRPAEARFVPDETQNMAGLSARGVSEAFSTGGARSFYGSSKLASELIIQEYACAYNLPCAINRCGAIAGAGQWGKTDQGVFTLWMAHHFWGKELRYTGFGGQGQQVRDLLHPADLFELLQRQIASLAVGCPLPFNVGGGAKGAVSLREWTALCQQVTGREVAIGSQPETAAVDVPYYVSDNSRVFEATGWQPRRSPTEIAREIGDWLERENATVASYFA